MSEQLADALRAAIAGSKLSQNEIADATGVSAGVISRFVRGERTMTLETAEKIAKLLRLELKKTRSKRSR